MKRCPDCRRDYYDDSLMYCLDDGATLLEGPGSDEPQTEILDPVIRAKEAATLQHGGGVPPGRRLRLWIACGLVLVGLVVAGVIGYRYMTRPRELGSIAVLPLINESGNPDNDYLSDGLTEILIDRISQLGDLRVKSPASVSKYKGKDVDVRDLARDLGVEGVIRGRLTGHGSEITVSLSLVDATTDDQLWGDRFESSLTDLTSLQSRLAQAVSARLKSRITDPEKAILAKNYTTNSDAYRAYLRGRYQWNKRTEVGLKLAVDEFNNAILIDPNYALAYVGLADCYFAFPAYGGVDPADSFPKAKASVEKALSLDDTLADAHTSLARILDDIDWDWARAETEHKRGIAMNPNNSNAHSWYANHLRTFGRYDEAIKELRLAVDLDPSVEITNWNIGYTFYLARRPDEAIDHFGRMIATRSDDYPAFYGRGLAYEQKGRYDEAISDFETAIRLAPDVKPHYVAALAHALGVTGKRDLALQKISELITISRNRYVGAVFFAIAYMGIRDTDKACEWLQKGVGSHYFAYPPNIEPRLDPLRADPRFISILHDMNLF